VARGITTIRGMLGYPSHLVLRERVRKGELLGPTIYTSGPSLNGNTVPDEATAVRLVEEQKPASCWSTPTRSRTSRTWGRSGA
jgi:hypothetical protein